MRLALTIMSAALLPSQEGASEVHFDNINTVAARIKNKPSLGRVPLVTASKVYWRCVKVVEMTRGALMFLCLELRLAYASIC